LCIKQNPNFYFVTPMVNADRRKQFEALWQAAAPDLPIMIIDGNSHTVLAAADVVLLASGTATLEAMLFKCPMVVAYRFGPISFWLAKRLVKVKHIGLPNILAGECIVPEFIQDEMTPHHLATAVLKMLEDEQNKTALIQRFTEIHHALRQDSHRRAAEAIEELVAL
jgi:lipid-A-disaccharide synthase